MHGSTTQLFSFGKAQGNNGKKTQNGSTQRRGMVWNIIMSSR